VNIDIAFVTFVADREINKEANEEAVDKALREELAMLSMKEVCL
jgi:hypothetical protein